MRWVLARGREYYDATDAPYRMSATVMDISDRKRRELNEQFLNDLDLRLRQLSDVDRMTWEVVSRLGVYLNVDRCLWHDIDWQQHRTTVAHNWQQEDMSHLGGTYDLEDYLTSKQMAQFATGQTWVVSDVTTHCDTAPVAQNFLQSSVSALVSVPYIHLGLGLAIVQHFVELHGGIVQVESPGVGQGATFTATLPLLTEVSATVEINPDQDAPPQVWSTTSPATSKLV